METRFSRGELQIINNANHLYLSIVGKTFPGKTRMRFFDSRGVLAKQVDSGGLRKLPVILSNDEFYAGLYSIVIEGVGNNGKQFSLRGRITIVK